MLGLSACNSSINGGSSGGIHGTTGGTTTSTSTTSTGGSTGGSTTGSAPTLTGASQRCTAIATAVCTHDVACGILAASQQDLCVQAACANAALLQLADAEEDAGQATYLSTSLDACVADISDGGCSQTGSALQANSSDCQTLGSGREEIGGSCVVDGDCLGGDVCVRSLGSCGGVCTERPSSGPCGLGSPPIALGFYCGTDGGVNAQQSPPASCSASNQCLPPYTCVGQSGAGQCNVLGAGGIGASCFAPGDCAIGFICNGSSHNMNGTCSPLGAPGSACVKIVGSGDAGVQKPDPTQCQELENCDPVMLTCQAEVNIGANCNPDGGTPACAAGICLNADAGPSCQFLADGARCSSSPACASGTCVFDGGRGNCAASCG